MIHHFNYPVSIDKVYRRHDQNIFYIDSYDVNIVDFNEKFIIDGDTSLNNIINNISGKVYTLVNNYLTNGKELPKESDIKSINESIIFRCQGLIDTEHVFTNYE